MKRLVACISARLYQCGFAIAMISGASSAADAAIVYESTENRLIVSGRLATASIWRHDVPRDDHDPRDYGSRIRAIAEHVFANGWSGLLLSEWAFDVYQDNATRNRFKREQYAGLSHPRYGTVLAGKHYSVWYDLVASWTDYFSINGLAAQGTFGGRRPAGAFEGVGRADRAVSYRNRFDNITLGVMWQAPRDALREETNAAGTQTRGVQRNRTLQAAAAWHFAPSLSVAGAIAHSDIDDYDETPGTRVDADMTAGLLGLRWTPGHWYLAAIGGTYHNLIRAPSFAGHTRDRALDTAHGTESVAAYRLENIAPGSVQFYAGVNALFDGHSAARNVTYIQGIRWVFFDARAIVAFEHTETDDRDTDGQTPAGDGQTGVLLRYNF